MALHHLTKGKHLITMRNILARAAVVVALGVGALVATPGSASAAAYDGQSPVTSGCDATASTVRSAPISQPGYQLGYIELRYSSACRTAWARVVSFNGYQPSVAYMSEAIVKRNSDGLSYRCQFSVAGQKSCYTRMVNDAGVTSYARGGIDSGVTWYYGQTTSY